MECDGWRIQQRHSPSYWRTCITHTGMFSLRWFLCRISVCVCKLKIYVMHSTKKENKIKLLFTFKSHPNKINKICHKSFYTTLMQIVIFSWKVRLFWFLFKVELSHRTRWKYFIMFSDNTGNNSFNTAFENLIPWWYLGVRSYLQGSSKQKSATIFNRTTLTANWSQLFKQ